jgi:hypothetical protein
MKCVSLKKVLILSVVLCFSATAGYSQSFDRPASPKQQKGVSRKPMKQKKNRVVGPKSVKKAQEKQARNDRKLKKDYQEYVKENQKRSLEIQTPEVRERMKQNVKNADASYKAKKKQNAARTRNAARKYNR